MFRAAFNLSNNHEGARTMRLSQRYADHFTELQGISAYITGDGGVPSDNATRLGITAAEVTNINALKTAFDSTYADYYNPKTHTSIVVGEMKIADDNAYTVILPLRQRLKNGSAPLTPDDFANLGIHEDKKTRTPSERPTDVPKPFWVNSERMAITFDATEQSTEGANRVALPKYCKVAREIAVVAADAEPTDSDYHTIDTIGRSRFTLMFSAAEIGMKVYVRIAYENSAGRGPFSMPVNATII